MIERGGGALDLDGLFWTAGLLTKSLEHRICGRHRLQSNIERILSSSNFSGGGIPVFLPHFMPYTYSL
jgi:hypothetical protein